MVSDTLKAEFTLFTVTSQYDTRLGAIQGELPLVYSKGRGPADALIPNLFLQVIFKNNKLPCNSRKYFVFLEKLGRRQ